MDRLDAMRVFCTVVEADGFSEAARRMNLSKAAVSKAVSQLEEELGARLLNRTTRRLSTTEVGRAYFERCIAWLHDLEEVEAEVRAMQSEPAGLLRVTAPQTFSENWILPALCPFLERYPKLEVEVLITDRFVDLVEEGFDLGIRVASLADSSLVARRLCDARFGILASPAYLQRRGRPLTPADLGQHDCIIDTANRERTRWHFEVGGQKLSIAIHGRVTTNGVEAVRKLALCGAGLGMLPLVLCEEDLSAGRLEEVLPDTVANHPAVYAVYPHKKHLSAKVRFFVDHLAATMCGEGH